MAPALSTGTAGLPLAPLAQAHPQPVLSIFRFFLPQLSFFDLVHFLKIRLYGAAQGLVHQVQAPESELATFRLLHLCAPHF